ncbi:MAG: hypothetical protein KBC69_03840 [Candidatus Magasanikbacteria bacterium]|nr:hypothetical protein [Candidatus Magasanikbacteria bacterium]
MEQSERRRVDPNLGQENFGGIGNPDTEWAQDLTRPATRSEQMEDKQWAEKIKAVKEEIAIQDAPMLDNNLLVDDSKTGRFLDKLKKIFRNNSPQA